MLSSNRWFSKLIHCKKLCSECTAFFDQNRRNWKHDFAVSRFWCVWQYYFRRKQNRKLSFSILMQISCDFIRSFQWDLAWASTVPAFLSVFGFALETSIDFAKNTWICFLHQKFKKLIIKTNCIDWIAFLFYHFLLNVFYLICKII